jgi:hypothetical protein
MSISHNTGVVAEGLGLLLEQFKGKPRITALLTGWLAEVQAVEDAMWSVWIDRLLQSGLAFGDLLDKIGAIVGQLREGFSDEVYTILITARIKANRSDGKRETLLALTELLVPLTTIEAREYVGAIVITPDGPVSIPPAVVNTEFLQRAVIAGVRLTFVWYTTPTASTLLFGYSRGGITDPTAAQSPGYYGTGVLDPNYIAGGSAAGALSSDGGVSL